MSSEHDWIEFDALIELMPWGRNVYTIIRLDELLEDAAKAAKTRRVEGTIEELPVNVGLNQADILPHAFMYAGKGLQRRLGARPGDVVHCRLRPADPDDVPLADGATGHGSGHGISRWLERIWRSRRPPLADTGSRITRIEGSSKILSGPHGSPSGPRR